MPEENPQGFALLCNYAGIVEEIVFTAYDEDRIGARGTSFIEQACESDRLAAHNFLSTLLRERSAFDWNFSMRIGARQQRFFFAGTNNEKNFLLLASEERAHLAALYGILEKRQDARLFTHMILLAQMHLHERLTQTVQYDIYDELSKLNNELATLHRELSRKNLELEKLNAEKNRFLGIAAHDVRSPLSIVLNYAEFLEEDIGDQLSEENLKFLRNIKVASNFMINLINNLLDISAIESGKFDIQLEALDLSSLARNTIELNRLFARKKHIDLVADIQPTPSILADPGKIEQVLNNLISNAIKYSHEKTTVTVSLSSDEQMIRVTVRDQGQGIPKAELETLFQPFQKTSVRSTAGEKSTGLGLAIVKKIIEAHHGSVGVESEVGVGSTFFCTLPIHHQ